VAEPGHKRVFHRAQQALPERPLRAAPWHT
jgi:hypothetical protein